MARMRAVPWRCQFRERRGQVDSPGENGTYTSGVMKMRGRADNAKNGNPKAAVLITWWR